MYEYDRRWELCKQTSKIDEYTHTNGIGHFDDSVYLFEIDLYERK